MKKIKSYLVVLRYKDVLELVNVFMKYSKRTKAITKINSPLYGEIGHQGGITRLLPFL